MSVVVLSDIDEIDIDDEGWQDEHLTEFDDVHDAVIHILDKWVRNLEEPPHQVFQEHLKRKFNENYEPLDKLVSDINDYNSDTQPGEKVICIYMEYMKLIPWVKEFGKRVHGQATGNVRTAGKKYKRVIRDFEFTDPFDTNKIFTGKCAKKIVKNPIYFKKCKPENINYKSLLNENILNTTMALRPLNLPGHVVENILSYTTDTNAFTLYELMSKINPILEGEYKFKDALDEK